MAKNPHPFGSIKYDNWNYEHPQERAEQVDPVWQARQTVGTPDEPVPDDFSEINARQAAALKALKQPGALRGVTESMSGLGGVLGLASLPAMLAPPVGAALGTAGSIAMAPDYLRRAIPALREEGEESPGLLESAVTVGPAALSGGKAALRGLRGLMSRAPQAVSGVDDLAGMLGGRAQAYEAAQAPARGVVDPMQELAQASKNTPIEDLLELPSFRNLPRGNVSKAKLATQAASPDVPESVFKRMQREGAFQGDRTTGQFEEGPGGLSSLAELSRGKRPSTDAGIINDMEEAWGHGLRPDPWRELSIPNPEPLSDMERLAARSAERFGRRFRRE